MRWKDEVRLDIHRWCAIGPTVTGGTGTRSVTRNGTTWYAYAVDSSEVGAEDLGGLVRLAISKVHVSSIAGIFSLKVRNLMLGIPELWQFKTKKNYAHRS